MNVSWESWDAARSALVADVLRRGDRLRLRVQGMSMLPALWPGDEVEISGCHPEDVCRGEIVLAHREGRFFLHRFVARRNPDSFALRGDAMDDSDPLFTSQALLGRLVRVSRGGRSIAVWPQLWSRPLGLVLCYCGLARRLALKLHRWRESRATFPLPVTATGPHDCSS